MMTGQELSAVPIGGKVKTGTGEVLVKVDACSWKDTAKGDVFDIEIVYNLAEELLPIKSDPSWQEIARLRGWTVAEDGSFAGRFTPHCRVFVLTLDHGMFSLHLPGDEIPDGFSFIGDALDKADQYANLIGGWK